MTDSELIQQVARDMAMVKQAIMGNGVKGLNDRVGSIEDWIGTHPRECPLDEHVAETILTLKERKVSSWSIAWGVVGVIGMVSSIVMGLLK